MLYVQVSAFLVFFIWGLDLTRTFPPFAIVPFSLSLIWLIPLAFKFARIYRFQLNGNASGVKTLTNDDVDAAAVELRKLAEYSKQVVLPRFDKSIVFGFKGGNLISDRGQFLLSKDSVVVYVSATSLTSPIGTTDRIPWSQISDFDIKGWLTTHDGRRWRITAGSNSEMLVTYATVKLLLQAANLSSTKTIDLEKVGLSASFEAAADVLQSAKTQMVQNRDFDLDMSQAVKGYEVKQKGRRPTLGREIEGWKLIRKLGKGGFGEVFLGEKEANGQTRRVAVKIMNADDTMSENQLKEKSAFFMREAKLNISIDDNPYVLSATSFGDDPRPYIIYPFVEGHTLSSRLTAKKKLNEPEWWSLAYDLVSAIAHLEKEGVIHRDIKPENIMMAADRAVLLDLGISTLQAHNFTNTKGWGTEGWLAPEVVSRESKDLTSASDVFAAGMTLYAALKLRMPFPVPKDLKQWPTVVAKTDLDVRGLSYPEAALLSNMLLPLPEDRATTEELLDMIRPHVDLNAKAELEREHREQAFISDEDVYKPGFDHRFKKEAFVEGPFDGWTELQKSVEELVLANKAQMFSLQLVVENVGVLYFQAMVQYGGWVIEVMHQYWKGPELGTSFSQAMTKRDWNPPTSSAPNFHRYLGEDNPGRDLPKAMTDVVEMVHGLRLSQVAAFAISVHGKNFEPKSSKK
jgi:serine/threonine protein kinase